MGNSVCPFAEGVARVSEDGFNISPMHSSPTQAIPRRELCLNIFWKIEGAGVQTSDPWTGSLPSIPGGQVTSLNVPCVNNWNQWTLRIF